MFSHEELRAGRERSTRLRRISGYLLMAATLIAAVFVFGAVVIFFQPGGLSNVEGWLSVCLGIIVFLIGTWLEAISQSVADHYELLEDIHHSLRKQQKTHEHTEG